jgi:ribosomal protein L29
MKKNDITSKSAAELKHELEELRTKLAQLQFDLADKKLKQTSELGKARRQIARVMTALKTAK